MAQVRALTVPLHFLVGVCGLEKEVLSMCFVVINEVVSALTYLRHSALVASVNIIGAGTPFRRPVCSLPAFFKQIEFYQRYPYEQTHDHGRGCLCDQDFKTAAENFRDSEGYVIYLTTPMILPDWNIVSTYWKNQHLTNRKLELVLLRQFDEDINSSVSVIMQLADRIATLPSISIVQAENDLIDLRRIMKPWMRRFQENIPSKISMRGSSKCLHLVLRSNMCFYREESRTLMHLGLANLTGLHYVPLKSIDGNSILGYPLNAEAVQHPSDNQFECKVLFNMLRSRQLALILTCTAPNKQQEYFSMVPSSSTFSCHWCFTLIRILSIDQITLTDEFQCSKPIIRDGSAADTEMWIRALPTQLFNPYYYTSGFQVEIVHPPQQPRQNQTRHLL
ncbi:hypothetical protein THRCLA_22481 [Thraustotheca clavata]|uniref:Uncharacterized protein n=1 Tax=Thraustotheca clavata TaxID=74557 RepID=A0A1V9YZP8_9STRA|nr:hypothetical protein THRCLA_22481 [Thraustotheca clavata]